MAQWRVWGLIVKQGATTMYEDSAAYVVSTSSLTVGVEEVTHVLCWTAAQEVTIRPHMPSSSQIQWACYKKWRVEREAQTGMQCQSVVDIHLWKPARKFNQLLQFWWYWSALNMAESQAQFLNESHWINFDSINKTEIAGLIFFFFFLSFFLFFSNSVLF